MNQVATSMEKTKDVEVGERPSKPEPTKAFCALTPAHRRYILGVVTATGFLGPLAGNIYLPALPVLQQVFNVSSIAINVTVSVFMLVFAFAPLFWTSFADHSGRRPLFAVSLMIYVISNVLLAAVPANFGALIFLRIVQAFGCAAAVSLGAGTVADVTEPKHRGKAMSYFLLGPQLGPVLGPIFGGAIAGATSWKWIFGFLALLGFAVWLVVLLTLPETLRCRVGNSEVHRGKWFVLPPRLKAEMVPESQRGPSPPKPTLLGYWKLFSYPPIGIVSFNTAILYATYFAIAVQLPDSLTNTYHWSESETGAGFLAIGLALIVGSLIGGRFNDWRRARFARQSSDGHVDPEDRLLDQIWGVILCAAGTMMFGFFVHAKVHPAAVLATTFLTGFGMSWVFVTTTAFLSESSPLQAAGAFALGNMLRNPAAAIAAVVLPPLIQQMGFQWCFFGLGALDLVIVGSAVLVLNIYGPKWRMRRKAAAAANTRPTPPTPAAPSPKETMPEPTMK